MKKLTMSITMMIMTLLLTVSFVYGLAVGQYVFDQSGGLITSVQSSYNPEYYQIDYIEDVEYTVINDLTLLMLDVNDNYYYFEMVAGDIIELRGSYVGFLDVLIHDVVLTVKTDVYVKAQDGQPLYDVIYGFYEETFFGNSALDVPDNILQIMTVSTMFMIALIPVFLVGKAVGKLWA